MDKQDIIVLFKMTFSDQPNESRHSLTSVDRIKPKGRTNEATGRDTPNCSSRSMSGGRATSELRVVKAKSIKSQIALTIAKYGTLNKGN